MNPTNKDLTQSKRGWTYSLVVWLVMVLFLAPVLLAWNLWDPLDALPYLICLAVGVGVSVASARVWLKVLHLRGWVPVFLMAWGPLLAVGLGLGGNVLLDSSARQAHATTFLGYSRGQKGPTRARFASWRAPGSEERVTCSALRSSALCFDFQQSPNVTVWTRLGAFGWEWVESVEPRTAR